MLFQESLNPGNDPVYFKDLEVEVLHSLERLKREMETKHHLKADIWCHFGTILIHQPDEGIIFTQIAAKESSKTMKINGCD